MNIFFTEKSQHDTNTSQKIVPLHLTTNTQEQVKNICSKCIPLNTNTVQRCINDMLGDVEKKILVSRLQHWNSPI